jgi:hypothetical protein
MLTIVVQKSLNSAEKSNKKETAITCACSELYQLSCESQRNDNSKAVHHSTEVLHNDVTLRYLPPSSSKGPNQIQINSVCRQYCNGFARISFPFPGMLLLKH